MLTDKQKKELLREHFLLTHMSNADLENLVQHSTTMTYEQNKTVFKMGDNATSMMVVISGRVQISSPRLEDDKIVFATMHPGDVFGEIALIDGHERSADATALDHTELLILEREDFLGTLEHNPKLCINLLKVLCKRIRHTNELLEDFTILDLRKRLAKRLIYLNPSSGPNVPSSMGVSVRISAEELIAMMGVSHDAIIRQLNLWNNDGLVKLDDEWITILDKDQLINITKEEN